MSIVTCPICEEELGSRHQGHSPEGAILEVLIQIRNLLKRERAPAAEFRGKKK